MQAIAEVNNALDSASGNQHTVVAGASSAIIVVAGESDELAHAHIQDLPCRLARLTHSHGRRFGVVGGKERKKVSQGVASYYGAGG